MNVFKSICSLLAILLLNSVSVFSQSDDKSSIDIRHYEFNISVNDDNNVIEGVARIQLSATKPVVTIPFDLASVNANGKGMKVASVSSGSAKLAYTHSNDKLSIKLPAALQKK